MKPARVRAYSPSDLPACRELYLLNEPGRFPEGVLPEFEKALCGKKSLFLVVERDGAICACGGVGIVPERRGIVSLYFGLVHPQFHGQGLGTTLLLARLAILPTQFWTVITSPVPASESFYRRFNFQEFGHFNHPVGGVMPQYYVRLPVEARDVCAALLDKARVELDVPFLELPER